MGDHRDFNVRHHSFPPRHASYLLASAILHSAWLSPVEKLSLTKPSSSTVTPCSSPTERPSWTWANISVDPVFCVLPARSIVICWFDAVSDGVKTPNWVGALGLVSVPPLSNVMAIWSPPDTCIC